MKQIKNLFKGRLNRLNFLFGFIILVIVLTVSLQIDLLLVPAWIIVLVLGLSLQVRRWHDFNRPWYYAISAQLFSMSVGLLSKDFGNISKLIYLMALIFISGSKGKNNYGDENKTTGLKSILGLQK